MKANRFLLAASIALAMAFTSSCSSDSDKEDTFFYSEYGVKDCSMFETIYSKYSAKTNLSFEDKKAAWVELKQLNGSFIQSGNGWHEKDFRNTLINMDVTPSEADSYIKSLKSNGNAIFFFTPNTTLYCVTIVYVELE